MQNRSSGSPPVVIRCHPNFRVSIFTAADMKSTSARFLYELDSPPSSTSKTNVTGNGNARQRQRGGAGNGPLLSSEPIQNLLYSSHRTRASQQKREERTRRDEQRRTSEEYLQQMPRLWRGGDVLAPHDLSGSEMRKWRRRPTRTGDVIDLLGINPLDHYSVSCFCQWFQSLLCPFLDACRDTILLSRERGGIDRGHL
jgi:hypothetical protein